MRGARAYPCLLLPGQGTYTPSLNAPAAQDALEFLLGEGRTYALAELLPIRFRPSDLLDEAVTPLLLQRQRHDLHLLPGALAGAARSSWSAVARRGCFR